MKRVLLPETLPVGIEAWLIEFNLDSPQLDSDWMLLDTGEQARALRFYQLQDRIRFIATRAALRRLLAERVMSSPEALRIEADSLGKPHLHAHSNIEFSVSHSGNFALIALSTVGEVGVDIEQCHRDVINLETQVFSSVERVSECWSSRNFIELWVVKESVLKALGLGISEYLQAITVLPNYDGSYCIVHDLPGLTGVRAWSLDVAFGYIAALALVNQNELRTPPVSSCSHSLQSA
jgi:4'-phosphopantetheinyl transferase